METYIIAGNIILALGLFFVRLRYVLLVEALFTILSSICTFFYTNALLRQYTTGVVLNEAHEFLARVRVLNLMMVTVSYMLIRKSVDVSTRTAVAFSRCFTYTISTFVMLFAHTGNFLTQKHVVYCAVPTMLWAVVMGVQLVRTGSKVNQQVRNTDVNYFLSLDMALNALVGVADLVHPELLTQIQAMELDAVHVYQYRVNGAVSLGNACFSWVALRFRFADEKRTVLLGRILGCLASMLTMFLQMPATAMKTTLSTQLFALRYLMLILPSVIGSMREDSGAFWIVNIVRHFAQKGRRLLTERPTGSPRGGIGGQSRGRAAKLEPESKSFFAVARSWLSALYTPSEDED